MKENLLLTTTEVGMLTYWVLALGVCLGLLQIPPEYMYSDADNPLVVAWNWSFFPIDLGFAATGLWARFGGVEGARRELLDTLSLTLMACAGLMAVSYWALNGAFDPLWWGLNLWLLGLASVLLVRRFRSAS